MGGQDLRQRRRRRGRARGPAHRGPARARAPDDRDGAVPDRRADVALRDRPADQGDRRLARDLDHPEHQPGRQRVRPLRGPLPRLAQEPPAERRLGVRRHRPQPQLGLQMGLLRRLQRPVRARDLPRRVRVLGARDAGGPQLRREPRRRRRPADQGLDRLPRVLGADPVAVRPHARRHRPRAHAGRPRHVRDARDEHGPHQRLRRPSSRATSTSPTARSTTGCGAPSASSPTRSRCTRPRAAAPASTPATS